MGFPYAYQPAPYVYGSTVDYLLNFFYFTLLCELRMQRLYTGGGGFTQLQTNTYSLVANQAFKVSIEVTSFI